MSKQLTAPGLTAPRVKAATKGKLNALQAAQLADCMKAGMSIPRMHQRGNKPLNDLPIFAEQAAKDQTKLF